MPSAGYGAIPQGIVYNGKLSDENDNPVSATMQVIAFRIFDAPTGGHEVWGPQTFQTPVTNGTFSVVLGISDDVGRPLRDALKGPERYVEVSIGDPDTPPTELTIVAPRQQLLSAPYAFKAEEAATVRGDHIFDDPQTGNVGIWTNTPRARLDVFGAIRLGNSDLPCNATTAGAIRFEDGRFLGCDGTRWAVLGADTRFIMSSSRTNVNLAEMAENRGINLSRPNDFTVVINSGVDIGSTGIGSPAFTTHGLPSGSTLTIVNNGRIIGAGGRGGNGANSSSNPPATAGGAGGNALEITIPTSIDNSNGYVFGGGGGGAGGTWWNGHCSSGGGGGGGAGSVGGAGGNGGGSGAKNGSAGSIDGAGTGGAPGCNPSQCSRGAPGGGFGQPGGNSARCDLVAGLPGGAAGKAIITNGNPITWIGGNDANRVRGAVQ